MTKLKTKIGWKTYRFDQVAYEVKDRIDRPVDSGLERYVGLEHLDPESLKIRRWGSTADVEKQKLLFKSGDIIFGRRNAYLRRVAVADFDGVCSAHAMLLRANTEVVLPEFLPFFMQTDKFWESALKVSAGSMSPTINWSNIAKEEFPLPPIEEQRRISHLLGMIDNAIIEWEIAKSTGTKLFNSSLAFYFSKDYVQNGSNHSVVPLSEISHLQTGLAKGKQYKEGERIELPYLSVMNVLDGYLDLTEIKTMRIPKEDIEKYRLTNGDIVITEGGDFDKVGRGAIWRDEIESCIHQNHIFCIRLNSDKLLPEFLSYQFRSTYGKLYFRQCAKKTSNLASINSTQVKQFPVLLYSMVLQKRIVSLVSEQEEAIKNISKRLTSIRLIKKTLMKILIER